MFLIKLQLRCDSAGCGYVFESVAPMTINGWPAAIPQLVIKALPLGWEMRGQTMLCPEHATLVKPAKSGIVIPFPGPNGAPR